MKKLSCATLLLIILISSALSAASIPGLYNTGVDDVGNVLSVGTPDSHYSLTGLSSQALALTKCPSWIDPPSDSLWIGPVNGDTAARVGDFTYTLTFDLSGLDPSTASISASWAADNKGYIYLNGSYTNYWTQYFTSLSPFQITSGFAPGINTLEFRITNYYYYGIDNPSGLLVSNLQGTAFPLQRAASSSVPIPSAIWLLGSGFLGIIGVRRRIKE